MKKSFLSELLVFWSFVWCVIVPEKAMLQGRISGEYIVQVSDNELVTSFVNAFAASRGVEKFAPVLQADYASAFQPLAAYCRYFCA
jgi:hypothetical protein